MAYRQSVCTPVALTSTPVAAIDPTTRHGLNGLRRDMRFMRTTRRTPGCAEHNDADRRPLQHRNRMNMEHILLRRRCQQSLCFIHVPTAARLHQTNHKTMLEPILEATARQASLNRAITDVHTALRPTGSTSRISKGKCGGNILVISDHGGKFRSCSPTYFELSGIHWDTMEVKKPEFQRRNPGFWDVTGTYRMSVWWSWGDSNEGLGPASMLTTPILIAVFTPNCSPQFRRNATKEASFKFSLHTRTRKASSAAWNVDVEGTRMLVRAGPARDCVIKTHLEKAIQPMAAQTRRQPP